MSLRGTGVVCFSFFFWLRVLDRAEYSAFESTLLSYRIVQPWQKPFIVIPFWAKSWKEGYLFSGAARHIGEKVIELINYVNINKQSGTVI